MSRKNTQRPQENLLSTPPVKRKREETFEDEEDEFAREWEAFVARHRQYAERQEKEPLPPSAVGKHREVVDPETWERQRRLRKNNHRRRQKKKQERQERQQAVTTLK